MTRHDLADRIRTAVDARDRAREDLPSELREDLVDAVVARLPDVPGPLTADQAGDVAFSVLQVASGFGTGADDQDLADLWGRVADREAELERVRRELAAGRRARLDVRAMDGRELIAELRRRTSGPRRRAGTRT